LLRHQYVFGIGVNHSTCISSIVSADWTMQRDISRPPKVDHSTVAACPECRSPTGRASRPI